MFIKLRSKDNSVNHGSEAFHHILVHCVLDVAGQVVLRVHLTDARNIEILQLLLILLLDPLVVVTGEFLVLLQHFNSALLLLLVVFSLERLGPVLSVEVLQHPLFDLTLSVADCN